MSLRIPHIVALLLACAILEAHAFTTVSSKRTFPTARVVPGARFAPTSRVAILNLSGDADSEAATTESKPMPTSGTYYDDEVDPIPKSKVGISETMKERLVREASSGLDSEVKQTNILLYIIGAVAVLVLLGGQGILF